MDALLMCGGRGTRLDADVEKPLVAVGGEPMIDRVSRALAGSRVGTTYAVVSPRAPRTREHVSLPTIPTPGEGYVPDLRRALDAVDPPVLTAAADLPLLAPDAVDAVLDGFDGDSVTVCVPAGLKREIGASLDTTVERDGRELAPTGVNVVAATDEETCHVTDDVRLAVNVNRPADVDLAEALL